MHLKQLLVGQAKLPTHASRNLTGDGPTLSSAINPSPLIPKPTTHPTISRHSERIRSHHPLNNTLPKPPRRLNTRSPTTREQNPRNLSLDKPLHDNRDTRLQGLSLLSAIADSSVSPERSPASPYPVGNRGETLDPKVGVVLSRCRDLSGVFGSSRRPYCDWRIPQLAQRHAQFAEEPSRKRLRLDESAYFTSTVLGEDPRQIQVGRDSSIRVHRHNEPWRHREPGRSKPAQNSGLRTSVLVSGIGQANQQLRPLRLLQQNVDNTLLMMDCFRVRGNDGAAADDQGQAQREREARELLLDAGADRLEQRPWQMGSMPPTAVDLIQFFLWKSTSASFGIPATNGEGVSDAAAANRSEATDAAVAGRAVANRSGGTDAAAVGRSEVAEAAVAALQLLPAARAEIDQLETGLLFAARGLGLTWAQMANALGLNSPQACQQRLDRLTARSRPTAEATLDERTESVRRAESEGSAT